MNQAFLDHRAKYRQVLAERFRVSPEMYDEISRLMAPLATHISVRKGEQLQRSGEVVQYIHWLHSGVARAGFLSENGNEVTMKRFPGVPHPFMHMDKDLWQAAEFIKLTAGAIKTALHE